MGSIKMTYKDTYIYLTSTVFLKIYHVPQSVRTKYTLLGDVPLFFSRLFME